MLALTLPSSNLVEGMYLNYNVRSLSTRVRHLTQAMTKSMTQWHSQTTTGWSSIRKQTYKTFEFKEPVIIYDISGLNTAEILTDSGDYIPAENYRIVQNVADQAFLKTEKSGPFRLYKDPGYVPGTHGQRHGDGLGQSAGKLVVGDLSDLDPDQMSRDTFNIDYNKFDAALIVGQTTGSMYTSFKAVVRSLFDDSTTIQDEFNEQDFRCGRREPLGFV